MAKSFMVSDLARQRRQVVDAARIEPVLVRDTDGELLLLQTAASAAARDEIVRLYALHAAVQIECRRSDPNRAVMGELAYVADWSPARRQELLDAMAALLADPDLAGDPSAVHYLIESNAPFAEPPPVPVSTETLSSLGARLREHLGA